MASIFNSMGDVQKTLASISILTNKIVVDGYFFPVTVVFVLDADLISYNALQFVLVKLETPVGFRIKNLSVKIKRTENEVVSK